MKSSTLSSSDSLRGSSSAGTDWRRAGALNRTPLRGQGIVLFAAASPTRLPATAARDKSARGPQSPHPSSPEHRPKPASTLERSQGGIIVCILRSMPLRHAREMVDLAERHIDRGVIGARPQRALRAAALPACERCTRLATNASAAEDGK